jgi:aspartyl-tRNA(Asn)/glutamyl-tRNA(Gln) amidotransferase subunit A
VPTTGALPLSTTLDTVGAITRDVSMAIKAHEILANRTVITDRKPLSAYKLAIVTNIFLDGMDDAVSHAWTRTLATLAKAGVQITEIELPELTEIAHLNRTGGFSPIEAYRWHKHLISDREADYDHRVAQRIWLGKSASEADYQTLLQERNDWVTRVTAKLQPFDAVLSPTVPIVAPTIASIETDDTEFFRVNGLLLRNPSIVNLLDGCGISIPCQASSELPIGLMIWHSAMQDDVILNMALQAEKALAV